MRSGAKWKAGSNVEVIHTYGIRQSNDGAALLKRYQRGVGGNYGRFTRRGDLVAAPGSSPSRREIFVCGYPECSARTPPTRFGWVRDRLVGFWRGLMLPPNQGFVSPKDLARMRAEYLAMAPTGAPAGDAV